MGIKSNTSCYGSSPVASDSLGDGVDGRGSGPFLCEPGIRRKYGNNQLMEGKDGISYVILRSCAETAQVFVHLNSTIPVYLDGLLLTKGMSCDAFAAGKRT